MAITAPAPSIPGRLADPFPYIVMYELTKDLAAYKELSQELTGSIKWMHYLPNVWFITRHEALGDLAKLLRSKVYGSDKLLVLPAAGPSDGIMPQEVWTWLNETLIKLW